MIQVFGLDLNNDGADMVVFENVKETSKSYVFKEKCGKKTIVSKEDSQYGDYMLYSSVKDLKQQAVFWLTQQIVERQEEIASLKNDLIKFNKL
jgi:hypothetical protein